MSIALPRNAFPLVVTAIAFTFLGLFLLYPLYRIFGASFLDASGATLTLHNYAKVVSSAFYRNAVLNSLTISVLATLVTTAITAPFAFAVARLPLAGKSALLALAVLPLVLPSFVAAYALVLLFGHNGVVTQGLQSIGIPVGSIYEGHRRFDLRLLVPPRTSSPEALGELFVEAAGGGTVPLAEVAKIDETEGPTQVRREALTRTVRVEVNLRGRDLVSWVNDARSQVSKE